MHFSNAIQSEAFELDIRCSAIHLDEVGSATVSLLSLVCFLLFLFCQVSSCCKDGKVNI